MKAKIAIKAYLTKDGIIDNQVKTSGDPNIMINALLDALYTICKENEVDINKVCKTLKEYHKNIVEELK